MLPYTALLALLGCSVTLFLVTTYKGFQNYHQVEAVTRAYDTSSLGSAARVARSATNLISSLSESLESESATSSAAIAARYEALQNYLREIDSATNGSTLTKTINLGLSYGINRSLHDGYVVDLIQSNYIPPQMSSSDPRYAQTLISPDNLTKLVDLNSLRSDFAAAQSIRISPKLLNSITKRAPEIQANPAAYGVELSDRGIDIANLPNGVQIKWEIPFSKLSTTETKEKYTLRRIAVAQIRTKSTVTTPVDVPPTVEPSKPVLEQPLYGYCNPGFEFDPMTLSCYKLVPAIDLMLQAIPNDRLGVIYNPNLPISKENPIEIVNKKYGGMNSIYKEDSGYLHISIGAIPTKANAIEGFGKAPKILEGDFEVSATLYDLNQDEDLGPNLVLDGSAGTINLDWLPRSRARYGTITDTFKHNGIIIPEGSIIVALREPGLTTVGRPSAKAGEFAAYKIYNANGVYIGSFAKQFGIDHSSRINIEYTPKGTTSIDPRFGEFPIYQDFSISDLFKHQSAFDATGAWLRMQANLVSQTQIDILSRKQTWNKRVFDVIYQQGILADDVSDEEIFYISNVYDYEGNTEAIKLIYGDVQHADAMAEKLFNTRFEAALAFAKAYVAKKQAEENKSSALVIKPEISVIQAQKELDQARAVMKRAQEAYDIYVKSLANSKVDSGKVDTKKSDNKKADDKKTDDKKSGSGGKANDGKGSGGKKR